MTTPTPPTVISDNTPLQPPDPLSPSVIAKSVHDTLDQAMAAIPAGKSGAVLIDGTIGLDGKPAAQAVIVQKIGANWAVAASAAWDGAHVEGKVAIEGSW